MGPNMPIGSESSFDRIPPSKCTSPPNAKVTGSPLPRRGRVVVVVVDGGGCVVVVVVRIGRDADEPSSDCAIAAIPRAAPITTAATTVRITTRRTTDQRRQQGPTYPGFGMSRLRISPRAYRQVTLGAAILLALIIVSGAAVRLTGSGLGCPEWPNCTSGKLTAGASDDVPRRSSSRTG